MVTLPLGCQRSLEIDSGKKINSVKVTQRKKGKLTVNLLWNERI